MNSVAFVSTFEAGFQPLLISTACAQILKKGITPDAYDLYLDCSHEQDIAAHSFIGIALPLFDSLHGGVKIARKIKNINPQAHICFYGPYAYLNREQLLGYGDSIIIGEWETPLADMVMRVLDGKNWIDIEDVHSPENPSLKYNISNGEHLIPARHLLPSIREYKNPMIEKILKQSKIIGNVETSRGCHHGCQFCSVYAVYQKKVLFINKEIILADIAQLVDEGADHITFIDAEFINNINFSLAVVEELHARYPNLTYDFTSRSDHIVKYREEMKTFRRTGCIAITTSIEFPLGIVLEKVQKGIKVNDIVEAIEILKSNDISASATFVMFNPWVDLAGVMSLRSFIKKHKLEDIIDPIQYETKLHLYKGSPLLKHPDIVNLSLEEMEFHWEWKHPDPLMEEFHKKIFHPTQSGELKRCCVRC